jgi:hypothetical protein
MNELGMHIKHPKLRGEWAELRFMAAAAERGFRISKPWGDTAHYDFGIEFEGHTLRVQVKSTLHKKQGRYTLTLRSRRGYANNAFDFLAAYVLPEDVWYIIPGRLVFGHTSILIIPGRQQHRFAEYRDAWHLLQEHAPATAAGFPADCPWPSAGRSAPDGLVQLLNCVGCERLVSCFPSTAGLSTKGDDESASTPPPEPRPGKP